MIRGEESFFKGKRLGRFKGLSLQEVLDAEEETPGPQESEPVELQEEGEIPDTEVPEAEHIRESPKPPETLPVAPPEAAETLGEEKAVVPEGPLSEESAEKKELPSLEEKRAVMDTVAVAVEQAMAVETDAPAVQEAKEVAGQQEYAGGQALSQDRVVQPEQKASLKDRVKGWIEKKKGWFKEVLENSKKEGGPGRPFKKGKFWKFLSKVFAVSFLMLFGIASKGMEALEKKHRK